MPSFPQYIVESLSVLLILAGFYHLALKRFPAFHLKRWYLRIMPVVAYSIPLLPGTATDSAFQPTEISGMAMERLWFVDFPAFDISLNTVLLAVFFAGFTISAFRLVDKIWHIDRFLHLEENCFPPGFQQLPRSTAQTSRLFFSWNRWSEEEKIAQASAYLPASFIAYWEVLLVEILCALNWWNPLMHWYRSRWQELYATDFKAAGPILLPLLKLAALPFILAAAAVLPSIPEQYFPTHAAADWISRQQDVVVFQYKKQLPPPYAIEWGSLKIPLIKYANPNGYVGEVTVELDDFKKLLLNEIKVFQGEKRLEPGTLSVLYRSSGTLQQAYINDIDPASILLQDRRSGKIYNDAVEFGDEIVLFGEMEDIYLSRIQIRITDPQAGYEPAVDVPDIDHQAADFAFQLVERQGQRTLVKLDSEHTNAGYLLQLYQDSSRYEIVKIPGFRTNRRYLTQKEALLSKFSAASFDMAGNLPDVNYLPEYQHYQDFQVSLSWGGLRAAPSVNVSPDKFLITNTGQPLLQIGDSAFELEAFEIIIAGNKTLPLGYHTDHLDYPSLRNTLSYIQPETSIYFDRIVIKDMDGSHKLFPASFAFHIGKVTAIQPAGPSAGQEN